MTALSTASPSQASSSQASAAPNVTSEAPISASLKDEMIAVLAVLNVAQLTEAYYILASIGIQLLADASLVIDHPAVAGALNFAGNEVLSLGHATAAMGSQVEVNAAQYALGVLVKKSKSPAAARPHPARGLPRDQGAGHREELSGILDPSLVYGTWQRLETDPSGQLIMYKVTRNELVKINATTDRDGVESIRTECHPGSVVGYVNYRRPTGSHSVEDSTGKINVVLVVEKSNGHQLSMTFTFLRAKDAENTQSVDVLVENEGEKKAFVRLSKY